MGSASGGFVAGAGSPTTLASGITYKPFGPWTGFTYGNGIVETPTIDADYRLTGLVDAGTSTVQNISYTLEPDGIPASFADTLTSANSLTSLTFDPYAHLVGWHNNGGATAIGYDTSNNVNNGSRKTITGTTYTNTSGTDQLATITTGGVTNTVTTNANGNITGFSVPFGSAGVTGISYNNANRLTTVSGSSGTLGSYVYDAFGQRFSKTVGANTTLFTYAGSATLAETTGGTATNYIYLNGRPLAMLTGSTFAYLHGDNLGTPRVATNASQAVVWSASYLPFGETRTTSGTFTQNLRFPGQYFDAESGFNHNNFRDYVPSLGRYLEADPIGIYPNAGTIDTGMNPYIYVGNAPMGVTDVWGLGFWCNYMSQHPKDGTHQWLCDEEKRAEAKPLAEQWKEAGSPCGAGGPGKCDEPFVVFDELQGYLIFFLTRGEVPLEEPGLPRWDGPKPEYDNPGTHDPSAPNYVNGKDPLPPDAEDVYKTAVPDDPDNARHWYGQNSDGEYYQFHNSNDGKAHYAGRAPVNQVPPYARQRLNGD